MTQQTTKILLCGVLLCGLAVVGYRIRTKKPMISETPEPTSQIVGKDSETASTLETITIPEIPGRTEGQRFAVNGIELYFETFGSGAPLLLLHGGGATIESWFAQIPEFSKKFKLIVPDSRGHGRTNDAAGPIDFALLASDFEALLDHLGIESAMIVGWSDGGVIGLEMAMRRPDLVAKIVAFGAHARPEGMTPEFKAEVETFTPESFPAILSEGYKALSPDGPEHWPVVFGKLKTMWLTQPDYQDDQLRSIRCPVLLLVGETDIVREEESRRMASLIPKARLKILKGTSHYAPVEVPEVVNGEIIGFLEEP